MTTSISEVVPYLTLFALFFEIDSISKEINSAEHEYMNMSPSLIELATPQISKP